MSRKICITLLLAAMTVIASSAQTLTTLHSFDNTDGSYPGSGLIQGADGNFYGTTAGGGANETCNSGAGCGTVFQITPAGALTTLHSFDNTGGSQPNGLIQGSDGKFYGTTAAGGAGAACIDGCGTIYAIVPGAPQSHYTISVLKLIARTGVSLQRD